MVDILDRLDLLELPGQSAPWRETGPEDDAFLVDWRWSRLYGGEVVRLRMTEWSGHSASA